MNKTTSTDILFVLPLQNNRYRNYQRIGWIIAIINLIIFVYQAISSSDNATAAFSMAGSATLIISMGFTLYFQLKKKRNPPVFLNSYLWITITWWKMGHYWLAGGHFALIFLEQLASRPLLVSITDKLIEYPSLTAKKLNWNEVNNIILKDGLLTIDCKNNRVFQQEVTVTWTNEEIFQFNTYCRNRIEEQNSNTQRSNR